MKAVVLEKTCNAKDLNVSEVAIPKIKPGYVLVKVLGFGLNRAELILREHEADESYINLPIIPGIECVGKIANSSDSIFKEGELVCALMKGMGRSFDGSYAEYVLLPTKNVFSVNEDILDYLALEELIAVPETYFTAWGSLFQSLKLNKNDTLLIRGGTSATGIASIQLAKSIGVSVIASSRNPEKLKFLEDEGVDLAILDDGEIYDKLSSNNSFYNINKVLELVGPATLKDSMKTLKNNGFICVTGVLGQEESIVNFDPIKYIPNGIFLSSFFSNYPSQDILNEIINHIIKYNIKPLVSKVFSLEEIANAHDFMENNEGFGKIIVLNDLKD